MKIKFGALVVAGSGKIGGQVASKNRAGAYLRTKVTPSNPKTTFQTTVRNRLATISQAWRALTAVNRAAWNAAVNDYKKSNVFGDIKIPSGFNLYQRLNNNILACGGSVITAPPLPSSVATFSVPVLTYTVGTPALTLAFTVVAGTTTGYKLFATAPHSAGKKNVNNQFRLIKALTSNPVTGLDIKTDYINKFGSIGLVGQQIDIKIVGCGGTTGITGTPVTCSTVSAA